MEGELAARGPRAEDARVVEVAPDWLGADPLDPRRRLGGAG